MKTHSQKFKKIVLGFILLAVIVSGLMPITHAARTSGAGFSVGSYNSAHASYLASPNSRASKELNGTLVINEIHSYGSGNQEWVELYNPRNKPTNFTDLKLTDQDGNTLNLSALRDDKGQPILPVPPNNYVVIYFGKGRNETNYNGYSDPITGKVTGNATIHTWWNRDVLNDDGDDLLLYNGTYGTKNCWYIDYVVYSNGGPNSDIDQPPMGSKIRFARDGSGFNGYAPAPGPNESIALVPNGQDTHRASSWYIMRHIVSGGRYDNSITPGMRNANILKVSMRDVSPVNQTQGTERAVIMYNMTAVGGNIAVFRTFVKLYGSIKDYELKSGLYEDTNKNGIWDSGDQSYITGYNTYSGHATTFSTPNINVQKDTTDTFFITVKLSQNASIFHNYSLQLIDMDTGMWSDNNHTNEVYFLNTLQTRYVKISPIDQTPPYVTDIHFNGSMPLGPGWHNVTVYFDKKMDTRIQPNVTYGLKGYEYPILGNWLNSTVWAGRFNINSRGPHGILTLMVRNAKDVWWNVMIPYKHQFKVDTIKPYIANITYSALPPYPAGMPVNITLTFSENVTNVMAFIEKNNKQVFKVRVYSVNATVYHLHFTTQVSWKSGPYTLYVFNATDSAGNIMNDFRTNFTVDTAPPAISYIEQPSSVVEGKNATFLVYATDNTGIKRVWAVYTYNGEQVKVEATKVGDYWTFQVVGGAMVPPSVTVDIYVQDTAGNVFKDEETITVIPWWQSVWWLWVILAIVIGFILYLVYDYVRRVKLREQLGEEMVPESVIMRMAHAMKRSGKEKKPKKKKKKSKRNKEEEEEEDEDVYAPPPEIPPAPVQAPHSEEIPEIPEVPYEDEYLDEETIEREE